MALFPRKVRVSDCWQSFESASQETYHDLLGTE